MMGVRRDLGDAVRAGRLRFEAALLIVTALSAAVGALTVSVPAPSDGADALAACDGGRRALLWAAASWSSRPRPERRPGRLTFAWHCVYKTASVAAGAERSRCSRWSAGRAAARRMGGTARHPRHGRRRRARRERRSARTIARCTCCCGTWRPLMLFAALGAALGTWLLRWKPTRRLSATRARVQMRCRASAQCADRRAVRRRQARGPRHASSKIVGMAVHRWNAALDGDFSEAALRGKLEAQGYRVARYVYAPGTVFPDHKHGVDKVDAVVSGRFRLIIGGHLAVLRPRQNGWTCLRGVIHSAAVRRRRASDLARCRSKPVHRSARIMRIAVIGAGGVGGYFGARLQAAGADVSFIARGAHLAALQARGLRLESPKGDLHLPTSRQATIRRRSAWSMSCC